VTVCLSALFAVGRPNPTIMSYVGKLTVTKVYDANICTIFEKTIHFEKKKFYICTQIKSISMTKTILSLILATFLLGGCKPTERIVYVDKPYPVDVVKVVNDTLIIEGKDSIVYKERNDTVFYERYSTKWREKIKVRVDSIPYPVKEIHTEKVEVEKPVLVKDWVWYLGLASLVFMFVFVVLKIKRIFAIGS
jgi:hypothetical protein